VAAIVLAAGAGTRFGGPAGSKLLAPLDGRPVLQHVLDRVRAAGVARTIVVVPPEHAALVAAIQWRAADRIVNPEPARGLASSVLVGWQAASRLVPPPDAVLVLLADQPAVPPGVLAALLDAPLDAARPVVAPRYRTGGGPNPLRIDLAATGLVEEVRGDRGLGPVIDRHPELVRWIEVEGSNPDVDAPEDLAALRADEAEPNDGRHRRGSAPARI
jgi:molybdenum cofactor cytidylyltransferase